MTRRLLIILISFFLSFGLVTCSNDKDLTKPSSDPSKISQTRTKADVTIWFNQGFLPEENNVPAQLVRKWEKESGYTANLTLIADSSVRSEIQKSISDGTTPDILYNPSGDLTIFPKLAWQNKLADVSDIVEPLRADYTPMALESAYYWNNTLKKRSFYAVPIAQQLLHVSYWKDKLTEAGFSGNAIPHDWLGFWDFWAKVQVVLRQKNQPEIYGIGTVMSPLATDTFWQFEHMLEAYDARLVDKEGNLQLDDPAVRQKLVTALADFTKPFKDGYVPPNSPDWTDSGNNNSFLSKEVVMTANPSLSIPLTQKFENNVYNRVSTDLYFNKIGTLSYPDKPSKQKMPSIVSIKQLVMFDSAINKEAAKSLLKFLINPDNLNEFLKVANKGRFLPVITKLFKDTFWSNQADPHISAGVKQALGLTRPFDFVYNPAYSDILSRNIWGKAIASIVKDNVIPEKAADNAIADIKTIFADWKKQT
jgi:multiple sugar transport system substrate-binding protein